MTAEPFSFAHTVRPATIPRKFLDRILHWINNVCVAPNSWTTERVATIAYPLFSCATTNNLSSGYNHAAPPLVSQSTHPSGHIQHRTFHFEFSSELVHLQKGVLILHPQISPLS